MEAAQISSPSTLEENHIKTANQFEMQSYQVRSGAIDVGKDYEIKMTALMALRCISYDVEQAKIVFNADGCSDFDDLVIYKKIKGSAAANISLVQLKHQVQAKNILADAFFNKKGNFSLDKYSKGFDEVLTGNFNVLKDMFKDSNINCNNVDLVLYTNRGLDTSENETNACTFLELYQETHYLNTNVENSNVYTFNDNHEKMQIYPKQFLQRLLIFLGQVSVNSVNKLILEEIQKIVPNISSFVVDNFIQFISCWAKGELGGFHVLTRTRIIQELTILLLDSYISKFITSTDNITIENKDDKFCQIIKNFDVILVSPFNNSVIEYLRGCVNQSFRKYFQFEENGVQMFCQLEENQFDQLSGSFDVLKLIPKNKVINGNIPLCDIYKALWQAGYVALSCIVDSPEEYLYVSQTLCHLKPSNKCIILSKSQILSKTQLFDNFNVLCNLDNLNTELSNMILDEEVKFQNRGPFKFQSIIKDVSNVAELITTHYIICILNGTFYVGDILPALPDVYIPRTLPKIILNFDVFKIKNHIFVVACKDKKSFQNCIKSNPNCKIFDSWNDIVNEDLESEKCLIVLQPYDTNFSSLTKLWNKDTHYLKLLGKQQMQGLQSHDSNFSSSTKLVSQDTHFLKSPEQQQQIQWLKSCGDVNPLRSYVKDTFGNTFYFSLEHLADTGSNNITSEFPNALNIISAGPGMGKSIAMNIVALRAPVDRWVLRIDLNKYLDYFNNLNPSYNTPESHLNFFGTKLLEEQQRNTKLNEKLFTHFLNSKNVLILFDGFDEIAPAYKKCVTQMIYSVQICEFPIWITTRPVLETHVEKQFSSLYYTLNSFTKENQIEFLQKYFLKYIKITDECIRNKINSFTTKLLELSEANLGVDILNLMGIPLQTRILAEVYLPDCKKYIEYDQLISKQDLNILHLYERFVDLKQKEFISKFNGDDGKRIVKSSDKYHKLYAFKTIFLDQTVNQLGLSGQNEDNFGIGDKINVKLNRFIADVKDASNNVGIIVPHDQLNLSFLHRTFAEYYAALWLTEKLQNPKYKRFIEKLMEPNYELVRNFFDRIIIKDLPLHTAIMNRNIDIVRNIIDSNKSAVNERDRLDRTPLYLLATWVHRFPLNTFNRIISSKSNEQDDSLRIEAEISKLLFERNFENIELNAFEFVKTHNCLSILKEFAAISDSIDIRENLLDGLLYFCVKNEFLNLLRVIFRTHPKTKDLINNLTVIIDGDMYNLLQVAVLFQNLSVIAVLLEHVDIVRVTPIIKPFRPFRYNKSAIIESMQQNYTTLVEKLLFGGVNINATNNEGDTVLCNAVRYNKYQLINLLLNYGANTKLNDSPLLHYPTKLLLLEGVDLNIKDSHGNSVLHIAAFNSQNKIVELLVSRGADLNVRNNFFQTILHAASAGGKNDTIDLLLLKGVDLNVRDNNGDSVLHIAAYYGQNKTVELLLSRGVDLNVKNNFGRTILHEAAAGGHNDTIKLLLLKGLDLKVTDKNGDSVLHMAAMYGQNNTMELLFSRGVDFNVRNNLGRTVLHYAAGGGKNDTVELLLSRRLDLDVKDYDGDSALHIAALNGQNKTLELLLSKGVDINVRNNLGSNILHHAALNGHNHTIELLLLKGVDLHCKQKDGNSVLHIAAFSGHNKTVELLLSRGVNINVRNNFSRTILHCAVAGGKNDTIELLLLKKLDLNDRDCFGNKVLHIAVMEGQNKTVELLLSRGVDLNARNFFGSTALNIALESRKVETAKLLRLRGAV